MGEKKVKAKSTAFERLCPQHKRFVVAFMETFNATRAYIQAGYSKNGADANASRLIGNDSIAAALGEQLEKHGITAERIKCEFAGIAFGNEPSKIVTGVNAHREQDRVSALRELARIVGMITEKQQVTHTGAVNVVFDESDPKKLLSKAEDAAAAKKDEE